MNNTLSQQVIGQLLEQARPFLPLICQRRECTDGMVSFTVITTRAPEKNQWWVKEHVLLLSLKGDLVEAYQSQTLGLSVSPRKRWDRFPIESVIAGLRDCVKKVLVVETELKQQQARFDNKLKRILAILAEDY